MKTIEYLFLWLCGMNAICALALGVVAGIDPAFRGIETNIYMVINILSFGWCGYCFLDEYLD